MRPKGTAAILSAWLRAMMRHDGGPIAGGLFPGGHEIHSRDAARDMDVIPVLACFDFVEAWPIHVGRCRHAVVQRVLDFTQVSPC
jgi:hypothetical protein